MNCSWGQALNVANRYIYVTQPLKDRVLVISKIQMVVVDVSNSYFSYYLISSYCPIVIQNANKSDNTVTFFVKMRL